MNQNVFVCDDINQRLTQENFTNTIFFQAYIQEETFSIISSLHCFSLSISCFVIKIAN